MTLHQRCDLGADVAPGRGRPAIVMSWGMGDAAAIAGGVLVLLSHRIFTTPHAGASTLSGVSSLLSAWVMWMAMVAGCCLLPALVTSRTAPFMMLAFWGLSGIALIATSDVLLAVVDGGVARGTGALLCGTVYAVVVVRRRSKPCQGQGLEFFPMAAMHFLGMANPVLAVASVGSMVLARRTTPLRVVLATTTITAAATTILMVALMSDSPDLTPWVGWCQ